MPSRHYSEIAYEHEATAFAKSKAVPRDREIPFMRGTEGLEAANLTIFAG